VYGAIVRNFRQSLLVLIGTGAWLFFEVQAGYPQSVAHLPVKVGGLIEPALLIVLSVILWFACYKDEEGHLAALVMGALILFPALGAGIAEAIYGDFYRDDEALVRWYIGLSHIL